MEVMWSFQTNHKIKFSPESTSSIGQLVTPVECRACIQRPKNKSAKKSGEWLQDKCRMGWHLRRRRRLRVGGRRAPEAASWWRQRPTTVGGAAVHADQGRISSSFMGTVRATNHRERSLYWAINEMLLLKAHRLYC
jgi:hypothetical protein